MASSHGIPHVQKESGGEEERGAIENYRGLLDAVTTKINERQYTDEVLALTSKLLKKNPEFYTIWNYRRLILLHRFAASESHTGTTLATPSTLDSSIQETITNELRFIVPLLIQYPKCYWIWNYRMWLLEEAEKQLGSLQARRLWEEELDLVGKMLTRDERNFHGWGYRRFVVEHIERLRPSEEGTLVEQEYAYTSKMIKAALHNFSALHYRSKLLPRLLNERRADGLMRREILQEELNNMQEALIDPFNQSAWFYHQFLMSSTNPELPKQHKIVQDFSSEERDDLYRQELVRIQEIIEDYDDCKWVYEALILYSLDYRKINSSAVIEADIQTWLVRLRHLDPMRSGRWADLADTLKSPPL